MDRVKAKFEPSSYSLCTDDAITNLAMARLDGNTQINLCGPHGVNRAAIMATDETEVQDSEFKVFNRTLRRFMEKSSRCKYNQKFLNNDGWIKFKWLANTRWDSMCFALETIRHNFDVLKEAQIDHALIKNYSKQDILQQYYDLILPMRQMNQKMQLTSQTSGQLVAKSYHMLLIHFAHFTQNSSNVHMLRRFANNLVNNINSRMTVASPIRLLWIAFYKLRFIQHLVTWPFPMHKLRIKSFSFIWKIVSNDMKTKSKTGPELNQMSRLLPKQKPSMFKTLRSSLK